MDHEVLECLFSRPDEEERLYDSNGRLVTPIGMTSRSTRCGNKKRARALFLVTQRKMLSHGVDSIGPGGLAYHCKQDDPG